MKISYLLASNHGIEHAINTINNIYQLPSHDFEIIACSPYKIDDGRCKSLIDISTGSASAFNFCYKHSVGEYIILCLDDHTIPPNILEILDYFNSYEISKLKLKVANLTESVGGPGKIHFNKKIQSYEPRILWEMSYLNFGSNINNIRPYNVIHFPAFERKGIEKYLDNVIFNESFVHHYVDHWLGFYEEKINGTRETEQTGPSNIYFKRLSHVDSISNNTSYDSYDFNLFQKLVNISNLESTTYNTKIT